MKSFSTVNELVESYAQYIFNCQLEDDSFQTSKPELLESEGYTTRRIDDTEWFTYSNKEKCQQTASNALQVIDKYAMRDRGIRIETATTMMIDGYGYSVRPY